MCAITGIFNFKKQSDSQLSNILKMTRVMKHRGPDDEGYVAFTDNGQPQEYFGNDTPLEVRKEKKNLIPIDQVNGIDNIVTLGHRRLSIIDLTSGGHQPMTESDNRYWIVYNGEIYNYIEIRDELISNGYSFRTESDTEVILYAYIHWGDDCLSKFNGDWSFLIYDNLKNEIFVSRDRFGIKPLFYYQDNDRIVFSSEIKGLINHDSVNTEPNIEYLNNYLKYGDKEWIKETAFTNVYRFPFAHFAKISLCDGNSNWTTQKYWENKPNLINERFCKKKAQMYADEYYALLEDAVRLRLRADVKIGSALSGGLDSSSIVYLINQQLRENKNLQLQETFSSVYKNQETKSCDESKFVDLLEQKLKFKSNQIEPNPDEIPNELEKVIWNMESPPDTTCMSGWYTYKLPRRYGVIVTLDGQGADEQLSGYLAYIINYLALIPISQLLGEIWNLLKLPGSFNFITRGFIVALAIKIVGQKYVEKSFKILKNKSLTLNLNAKLANDFETSLVNLLHYVDRASMGNSIESRMPFMDHRLVEFLSDVPYCYKFHDGWTKYIARLAFDKKLPSEICWRRDKMGWPIPEEFWFNGPLRKWLTVNLEGSSLLKRLPIREFRINKKNTSRNVKLLNISLFEKIFFKVNNTSRKILKGID